MVLDYVNLYFSEYKVLLHLYLNPNTKAKELSEQCKVAYSSEVVKRIRDKGIQIHSEYVNNDDKQYSNRKIVLYSIMPESKSLALASLHHYQKTNKVK